MEFDCHPIDLFPKRSYSPASIAKSYLRAMGIRPPLERFRSIPKKYLGIAMSAYYGGRAEIRLRKTLVPVVYLDFLSMYPTVNALLGIWDCIRAAELKFVDATGEVQRFLDETELQDCFNQETWRSLLFFAEIEPDGEVLPVRTQYNLNSRARNIGVNPLKSRQPLWYSGADLLASKILTGKAPRVRRAFRIVPKGVQDNLRPVKLGGSVRIDPARADFFRAVIEKRKGLGRENISPEERERIGLHLKVLANSGSYGIFAEFNREENPPETLERVTVHGSEGRFSHETSHPELPGEFCFPPLAACTTAAARLMLAMLEACVTELGGTYAFCDTDSMAIVATEHGGLVACPGGPHTMPDGSEAIMALSWTEVREITRRFERLCPYDPAKLGSSSILEIEKENLREGKQIQLYAYAISAKRYALVELDGKSGVQVVKHSEHGLGHLMNPEDPDSEDGHWTEAVWLYLIRRALGIHAPEPDWIAYPAISKTNLSSPHVAKPFERAERGLAYQGRTKPFNFLCSAHVAPFGHPSEADVSRFHLVAPYSTDRDDWLKLTWRDVHTGNRYWVTTEAPCPPDYVRLVTYREVLSRYEFHPEPKSLGSDGEPCSERTVGLLRRRPVTAAGSPQLIGKESNLLEAVQSGEIHDWDEVFTQYGQPDRGLWDGWIQAHLKKLKAKNVAKAVGISERYVKMIRNGKAIPAKRVRLALGTYVLARGGSLGGNHRR